MIVSAKAVVALQRALVDAGLLDNSTGRAIDGVVGPRTLAALERAPELRMSITNSIVDAANEFAPTQTSQQAADLDRYLDENELADIVRAAVAQATTDNPNGVVALTSAIDPVTFLTKLVRLEAAYSSEGFDVRSEAPSGLYHGLGQVGVPAWTDAVEKGRMNIPKARTQRLVREGRFVGTTFENGFKEQFVWDPATNLRATLGYAIAAVGYYRSFGRLASSNLTFEMLYAHHNQGPSIIRRLITGSLDHPEINSQSAKAKAIIVEAYRQMQAFA